MMKLEWRKHEKELYLPKGTPTVIEVPPLNYFVISGEGNPNSESFSSVVEALYAASYSVRMCHKKGLAPDDFYEYTVYPLEGVWDINDTAKARNDGSFTKDELKYDLMIRQPDFLSATLAETILQKANEKKPNPLLEQIRLTTIHEGKVVQMLHLGSYDTEPESFEKMAIYCEDNGLKRLSKTHREIYLSDARKVVPDKLKTVLRIRVK
jgi:hypothetical protein